MFTGLTVFNSSLISMNGFFLFGRFFLFCCGFFSFVKTFSAFWCS